VRRAPEDCTLADVESSTREDAAVIDLYAPLRLSLAWLLGTYILFLIVGQTGMVDNLAQLTLFVLAATGAFAVGYLLKGRTLKGAQDVAVERTSPGQVKQLRLITAASALYFLIYGLAMLAEYGVGDSRQILSALRDPGSAYLAKFDVYDQQIASGATNPIVQALTLLAVLSTPLVPFLIVHLRSLTADVILFAALGLAVYALFFLSIGTLSGLGNLLIFATVAYLVTKARSKQRRRRRWSTAAIVIAAIAFAGYMAYNQASRLHATGAKHTFEPNPVVARFVGENLASGVTVMAFYPTHGYQGLAYNLQTPFRWTHGLGASRALDSYWSQYGLGDSVAGKTYPARTEQRTGWPADTYWATIYPWLASDLTFPGTVLFMGFLGWWLASLWFEAVVKNDKLALLLLCQLAMLIVFVPANNQLGISRVSLVAVTSVLALYALKRLHRHLPMAANRAL